MAEAPGVGFAASRTQEQGQFGDGMDPLLPGCQASLPVSGLFPQWLPTPQATSSLKLQQREGY